MVKHLEDVMVLVADDAPLNLLIMNQLLTNAGATVITAVNGREVLEKLEEHIFDIVLMDLQMPELDGFEATATIRNSGQRYSNIPVIAVTAETSPEEIKKSSDVGMNDFITKPFIPQIIFEKILFFLQATPPLVPIKIDKSAPEELPDFNLNYLKEITDGQTDKLMMIINNLVENAPLLLQASIKALQLERWMDVAGQIHKLKGLVGLFFMPKITGALQLAEDEARVAIPNKTVVHERIEFVSSQLPILINLIAKDF